MVSEGDGNFFSKYQSLLVKAANRRNLFYTSLIFFNHFAYVSSFVKHKMFISF